MADGKKTVYENRDDRSTGIVKDIFDWYDVIVSSVVIIVLLFSFVFRIVGVEGSSMESTLHGGSRDPIADHTDRLVITNLFYTPKQGDIVVISRNYLNDDTDVSEGDGPIIKRVIATEGQEVDIDFEKQIVKVDGKELDEPYVSSETVRRDVEFPLTVEKGHIFVLGDNRAVSLDSRSSDIGQVDTRYVLGKAVLRVLPFGEFGSVYKNSK